MFVRSVVALASFAAAFVLVLLVSFTPAAVFGNDGGGGHWQQFVSDDGKPYFFNSATGESRWTDPSLDNSNGGGGGGTAPVSASSDDGALPKAPAKEDGFSEGVDADAREEGGGVEELLHEVAELEKEIEERQEARRSAALHSCLLYTSPSPRDRG